MPRPNYGSLSTLISSAAKKLSSQRLPERIIVPHNPVVRFTASRDQLG